MTDEADCIGEPLTLKQLAIGADLDGDHTAIGCPCEVCGILTWGPDGAWGHAPADDEMYRATTFVALRTPA